MNQRSSRRVRRSGVRGFALIEALVGILIFAFGIIGLVGLQAAMTRAQGAAKVRGDAAYLGAQVVGSMWSDRPNLAKYDDATCATYDPCTDLKAKVTSSLPGGTATLAVTPASGDVQLTLTWSTPAEGSHSYVLNTSIR
jgi:type IV pilus assembly protein PilV